MRRLAAAALTFVLAAPAAAGAQDGVFVDPESPTGKEYAIPLESARRQADPRSPRDGKVDPSSRSAPLFGEGIEADEGSGGGGGKGSGTGGRGGIAGAARDSADEAVRAAAARPGAPGGGTGSALLVGGAAFVLLSAVAGAYLVRRGKGPGAPA